MLFQKSKEKFSYEAFRDPDSSYRGAPFWSWNTYITKEMIEEQILAFKEMGMGGFHVHVRVGLKNQYMSEEFLELVRFCNEKAKENGMLCWLYDEDRYASGIAGGEVTKNVNFRARWLKLTVNKDERMLGSYDEFIEKQMRNEKADGCFLKAYDITVEDGYLKKARIIDADDEPEGAKWYLYIELQKESPWCNYQTYLDTLKPEAVKCFIEKTHEKYLRVLGDDFGGSIPAIFTDEPRFNGHRLLDKPEYLWEIKLPFTETLPLEYEKISGTDFYEAIPEIAWNVNESGVSKKRYCYYETLSRMFTDAYCRQIGDWCTEHGLYSTGHLYGEDSVRGQSTNVGEAMRCYREFHIPGIDNLCDLREFTAAKQASSIAHQYRKVGVLSELYGVTQWDFDFEGYKMAGDWQAALGVNVRVPHLAWASMNGESKRDYPAAIGWQSPWYRDYSYVEDHFARVNYCLTRGKPLVRVGVLHTVESFWLLQGPKIQSEGKKRQYEDDLQHLANWLLTGGVDFDYIAESSLEDDPAIPENGTFTCGAMTYNVILVPSSINLRKATFEKLVRFKESGGTVLFVGDLPEYVDCEKSRELSELVAASERITLSKEAILSRLDEWREISFHESGERRAHNLLYQMREEGDHRWLFIAQAYKGMEGRQDEIWYRRARHGTQNIRITLKGRWKLLKYDTVTGEIFRMRVELQKDRTVLYYGLYGNESLLLELIPEDGDESAAYGQHFPEYEGDPLKSGFRCFLPDPCGYKMSEPNVLLLDKFEYSLDGEEFNVKTEMLRLDNHIRSRLGLPRRLESLAQPYVRIKEEIRDHKVTLRTGFLSDIEVTDAYLALEEAEYTEAYLNGERISMEPQGYYVDPAIKKVKLPKIVKGKNELCLTVDYGDVTNLEWMYVLGDFGVRLTGAEAGITEKPEKLYWGDYTSQGFPFYTGNMTYTVPLPEGVDGGEKLIQVPYYSGAAVKVSVNGGEESMMAYLPYKCRLKGLREEGNVLELTCLGNRYNGFGQLHLIGDDLYWLGPNSWRTDGTMWADTYQLKPMGILTAPMISVK